MKQRDGTFDVMKGIGILAMIIGHSPIPLLLKDAIYTWHMPLFFLISGYFYRQKPSKECVKANFRQLFIPYIVTSLVILICAAIKEAINGKDDCFFRLCAMLVGSGLPQNPMLGKYSIGAIWFLQALFWCRIVFNILHIKIHDIANLRWIVFTLSSIATYVGLYVFIPTNILQGFQALLFFHIGHEAKCHDVVYNRLNLTVTLLILLLCFLSIWNGSIYMVNNHYGYWPINIGAATGITFLILKFSQKIKKNRFLIYCGRTSMAILCVHIVLLTYFPLTTIHKMIAFPDYYDTLINLITTLCVTWVILKMSIIRKLFLC